MSQTPETAARTGAAPASGAPSAPGVSIVVPVLNEGRHLRDAVTLLLQQEYAGPLEVVLALGPSSDDTDKVAAQVAAADDRVTLVPNPSGRARARPRAARRTPAAGAA